MPKIRTRYGAKICSLFCVLGWWDAMWITTFLLLWFAGGSDCIDHIQIFPRDSGWQPKMSSLDGLWYIIMFRIDENEIAKERRAQDFVLFMKMHNQEEPQGFLRTEVQQHHLTFSCYSRWFIILACPSRQGFISRVQYLLGVPRNARTEA